MLAWASLVTACGGGSGGTAPVAAVPAAQPDAGVQPTPLPAPSPSPQPGPLSSNVVTWGDSMIPAFAANLQVLMPDRAVLSEGFLGQTSTVIATNELADTDHRNWTNVFWYGHNNVSDPETIKRDIATSIAHLAPGNNRFIVLAVVNNADTEPKGTDLYWTIIKLNGELAALYPDNYIDIRAWLVAHYDPNDPGEVADFANDVPPRRLRYDGIHLRNEGSVLVAERVKQFIQAKGW